MTSCMVDGDPGAPILIIGEGPGREELALGKPFIGAAGWLLWQVCKSVGISRADCYIVNVTDQLPLKKVGGPSAAQIKACRTQFSTYVGRSLARVAIPLGSVALHSLTSLEDGITAWRGYLVKSEECPGPQTIVKVIGEYKRDNKKKGIKAGDKRKTERFIAGHCIPSSVEWVVPCLHPAGVLRSGRKTLPAFKADIERAKRALDGTLRPETPFIECPESVLPLDGGAFCVDVETTGILRVGLAGTYEGKPAVWSSLISTPVREHVRRQFERSNLFVAHNAPFDLLRLREDGMDWQGPIFDTMIAAYMLQPDLFKGLNEVASLYFDKRRWKHKSEEDNTAYNMEDAKTEWELYQIEEELLKETGMHELFHGTIMPTMSKCLVPATQRGIRVHQERRDTWLRDLTDENRVLLSAWQSYVGNVNPNSPPQVVKALRGLGVKLGYNKTGGDSTERRVLVEALYNMGENDARRPVLETYIAYKKNNKLLTTYASKPIGDDGRVHPHYLPVTKDSDSESSGRGAAGTGRIQPRNPNITQVPATKPGMSFRPRSIFIPSRDDMSIVCFDWKQIELRIAAALSGDANLLRALQEEDPFTKIAESMRCDRTRAKNCAYGTLFLGGPQALVNALKTQGYHITFKEAKDLQEAFGANYPDLWAWRAGIVAEVSTKYALREPFGRWRYFYQGGRDAPAAVDFMCQAPAAGVLWDSLLPVALRLESFGGNFLAPAHDEMVTELPTSSLPDSIPAIVSIMERKHQCVAPDFWVPCGVEWGPDWGTIEEWHD